MTDSNEEPTPIRPVGWIAERKLLARFPRNDRVPEQGHYEVVESTSSDPTSRNLWLEIVLCTPGHAPFVYRFSGVQVGVLENAVRTLRDHHREQITSHAQAPRRGRVTP